MQDRMIDFALECIKLSRKLPKTDENRVLLDQLIRSSSSVGANYTEANNAVSRLDFRNKLYTAKKEAAESRYWLRLIDRANTDFIVDNLVDESTQLILVLQKSVSTLKNGK